MPQVSIGQCENLEEAISALHLAFENLQSEVQELLQQIDQVTTEAREELQTSKAVLEKAEKEEAEAEQARQEAEEERDAAQQELSSADQDLATCECQVCEEGRIGPDCSFEAAAVSAASMALEAASGVLAAAEEQLELAKEARMNATERLDFASKAADRAATLDESVTIRSEKCRVAASTVLEEGKSRLAAAQLALDTYLSTNPTAQQFASWVRWQPKAGSVVDPAQLRARLNLSPAQQKMFVEYLADRDPKFRSMLVRYRNELAACRGSAERHATQLKVRRHMSGALGEQIVIHGLKPIAREVSKQSRTDFADGRYTRTDLVLKDLKVPVILGRGEGMAAGKGTSIAVEVKCGRADYLYGQKEHMTFQAGGHQSSAASMTVCSRDIKALTPEKQEELRKQLREAGSPMIGMLPRKEEIDKACWATVTAGQSREGDESC